MPRAQRQTKRWWRTRRDSFTEFWPAIQRELEADPNKAAKSIFQELQILFPGCFPNGQLRTMQRRVADWRRETDICARLEDWTLRLLQGKINETELQPSLSSELREQDVALLLDCIRYRGIRSRNRAVAVLANLNRVPISIICKTLKAKRQTVYSYIQKFEKVGAPKLVDFSRDIVKKADRQDFKDALFTILHEPPSLYGINRTRWEMANLQEVMSQKSFSISVANIRQIIRNAGYKFRKASKVLTSNDPEYRQKLQRITGILSKLQPDERFFSVDEFGPFSIKLIGGRSFIPPGQRRLIPQYQKSRGSLILTAALELSTNQITHFYSTAKNTAEMIRLIDLLFDRCRGERTLYFSWDAASWHASKKLEKHVNELNELLPSGEPLGPRVELAPLPARAQFLNVIESVFSGMARAIIHNSDYQSVGECKIAIDRYFEERNQYFKKNPKRAGKKIWGKEREKAAFSESNNCKDSMYR